MALTRRSRFNLKSSLEKLSDAFAQAHPHFFQSPEIVEAVGEHISVAEQLIAFVVSSQPADVADQLAVIKSILFRSELPQIDDDIDFPSFALGAARDDIATLQKLSVEAISAAETAGFMPREHLASADIEFVVREFLRKSWINALKARLDKVETGLLKFQTADQIPTLELSHFEKRILQHLEARMENGLAATRFELVDAEMIHLVNLETASGMLNETAENFAATAKSASDSHLRFLGDEALHLANATNRLERGTSALVRGHSRMFARANRQAESLGQPTDKGVETDSEVTAQVIAAIKGGEQAHADLAENIYELNLKFTGVRDLAPLSKMKRLRTLRLELNPLHDVAPLGALSELKVLDLSVTNVADISPLSGLSKLEWLSLSGTWTKKLSSLCGLKNLTTLDLSRTHVLDLHPLSTLNRLRVLNLRDTNVTGVEPLRSLKALEVLNLRETSVFDVAPLGELDCLKRLDLRGTHVVDISALSELSELEELNLMESRVRDLRPLLRCARLSILKVRGAPVEDWSPLKQLKSLRIVDVAVE